MPQGERIVVNEPYYATQCEHCGWYGSSEDCGEVRYDDDADVACPKCFRIIAGDKPDENLWPLFKTWDGEI